MNWAAGFRTKGDVDILFLSGSTGRDPFEDAPCRTPNEEREGEEGSTTSVSCRRRPLIAVPAWSRLDFTSVLKYLPGSLAREVRLVSDHQNFRGWLCKTAIGVSFALVAVGCGGEATPESEGELQQVEVLMAFPLGILRPGLVMALDRFFEEEGLDVTFNAVDGSSVVSQQLIAGNASFGILDTQSILIANSQGNPIRAVANYNNNVFDVVVPEDSSLTSIADIEGKTVGVSDVASGAVPLLQSVLAEQGLDPETSIELVPIGGGGPATFQAIQSGRVDVFAGSVNDFVALRLEGLTQFRSLLPDSYKNLPAGNWVLMEDTLSDEQGRSTITRIIRAQVTGLVYARDNMDEALEVACDMFPEECQDMDTARAIMEGGFDIAVLGAGTPWAQNNVDAWQTILASLSSDLLGESPVDVNEIATNELIDAINDFDEG